MHGSVHEHICSHRATMLVEECETPRRGSVQEHSCGMLDSLASDDENLMAITLGGAYPAVAAAQKRFSHVAVVQGCRVMHACGPCGALGAAAREAAVASSARVAPKKQHAIEWLHVGERKPITFCLFMLQDLALSSPLVDYPVG